MNQTSKKTYPKDIGALWIKEGPKGKYFSMVVEIDGVKQNFVGFKNQFKEPGDNKPDYRIFPKTEQQKPTETAEKLKMPKFSEQDQEDDLPF
jgi:hypothetical protein